MSKKSSGIYQAIYEIVLSIPSGRVMTYGQIASMLPGCTPRMVGYAMAALPEGSDVPWQRVINSQGGISLRRYGEHPLQRRLLEEEGVQFDAKNTVDLNRYRWTGEG